MRYFNNKVFPISAVGSYKTDFSVIVATATKTLLLS